MIDKEYDVKQSKYLQCTEEIFIIVLQYQSAINLKKPIAENLALFFLIFCIRNRTSFEDITYGLYLQFLGLSYRNATKALSSRIKKRSHIAICEWVQRNTNLKEYLLKEKGFLSYNRDETQL